MVAITLPDGNKKIFDDITSGIEVAEAISPSLAKAALAVIVNGELMDLRDEITTDSSVRIITSRDPEGLEIIRHDTAHILAEAVKLLYKNTQVTIGPVIENGFFYDFAREHPFSTEELSEIEAKMQEIINENKPITREIWGRKQAIDYYNKIGEKYKVEVVEAIPENEEIKIYGEGDFLDPCRGPHAMTTGTPKFFKLMKVAGAYWRGDSKNAMLQRIYGTAWASNKDLKDYLTRLEEAEKRDHRKLGKELELFHVQEEAVGQIFWHPQGWTLYKILEAYIREKVLKNGYVEVKTPILADKQIWEDSGHWAKFRENMFVVQDDDKTLAIKPMNCPLHIQIFNQYMKSYRDLPLRYFEFGCCHRNESSGSMHGLMRVRGFTQDDAHIFCTENDIKSETIAFTKLLTEIYRDFGFEKIKIKFSDRPDNRAGSDEVWDRAEAALKEASIASGIEFTINPGEGAFYGPKLEFTLTDAIGRDWQCGTLQVDFVLPERLGASYIGPDGNKTTPVMLHRAIFGSMERFIGILIENYAGKFPIFLSPTQVVVATITEHADEYASKIHRELLNMGCRAILDVENDKINYKIRQHSLKKIPIILVVGKNEMENNTVSIRMFGSDQQEIVAFSEFKDRFKSYNVLK